MIGLTLALLLAAQDPVWNCENPQAQLEMNLCAGQDFQRADAELNAAYRTAMAQAQEADRDYARITEGNDPRDSGPGEEASLREAQRAWVTFRDAHCQGESYAARGGSMQPMLYNGCRAGVTRARTAELRGPDPDCEAARPRDAYDRCLAGLFSRADAALNRQWQATLAAQQRAGAAGVERLQAAQRAWLAYRDAHCETAAANTQIDTEAAASHTLSCRTAMTEARTRELELSTAVDP